MYSKNFTFIIFGTYCGQIAPEWLRYFYTTLPNNFEFGTVPATAKFSFPRSHWCAATIKKDILILVIFNRGKANTLSGSLTESLEINRKNFLKLPNNVKTHANVAFAPFAILHGIGIGFVHTIAVGKHNLKNMATGIQLYPSADARGI